MILDQPDHSVTEMWRFFLFSILPYNVCMANLRQTLYAWRDHEAAKRNIELFRVLPNGALDEIVKTLPRTKEELTAIKGIKDAKYREYGKAILSIIDEHIPTLATSKITTKEEPELTSIGHVLKPEKKEKIEDTVFSVSTYLDVVNRELYRLHARVRGEVTSFKMQGSALYFSIKDRDDESTLPVFMWLSDYHLSGIEIAEGMEIIAEGRSEIYKPSGRLNFRAHTIELVGEGALKKAYEALKKKLDAEGVFALEKKRELVLYPERIGLITSKTGAVIHDFLNNLGKFGYKVRFMDSRVEGAGAVKDILTAIKHFSTENIDTLVIVRGGGSLESLQAFNHELVVRAIAEFPHPVVCAIGHDKDVPLAQLAADLAPSTPTATTILLNRSWEQAQNMVMLSATTLLGRLNEQFWEIDSTLSSSHEKLARYFSDLLALFEVKEQELRNNADILGRAIHAQKLFIIESLRIFSLQYGRALGVITESLRKVATQIEIYDPFRQLKLGYSILHTKKGLLRSVNSASVGEHFEARLSDGTLEAQVTGIKKIK